MTSLGLVIVLALVVGWLTAAATAVRLVSRVWLRHWAERRLSGEGPAVLRIDRPRRLLLAAGTGIASTVFAMGALLGLREEGRALLQYIVLAALLLLVVGQLVPRAVARRWARLLAPGLILALRFLEFLVTPLLSFAARLVRPFTDHAGPGEGEPHDALEELLREGELEGVGEPSESAIISGVLEFGEKRVADVMTPRAAIVAVERATPAAEVTRLVAQSKYGRIPVYERDLDHVVGLVHSFDVLSHPQLPLSELRPTAAARAETPCQELMRRMLRDRLHLAVIQGNAGETLGLVTLEDLVEQLVGEISDEHDDPKPAAA